MTEYVAFLRAVNVGRVNRLRMADLRGRWAALGLREVRTYLQTGNVAFASPLGHADLGLLLERDLVAAGLVKAAVMVRPRRALADLVRAPWFHSHPADEWYRYVTFLREAVSDIEISIPGFEILQMGPLEVVSAVSKSAARPGNPLARLESKLKVAATTRYWNVVVDFLEAI